MNIFRKKTVGTPSNHLKRDLNLKDLILLGLGAIIGTGIFVVTGRAASDYAGPAATLSFVVAALVVIMSGFSFAEFASRVPVSGGPYGYMYVVFGELVGWFTGWFLICEYILAISSVAAGWSSYFQGFLSSMGVELPKMFQAGYNPSEGTYVDIIAALVVIFVTLWVTQEAKKALALNNAMVWVKFAIIAFFVVVGIFFVEPGNWQPYLPKGWTGVFDGAALVFFAFLGFDAIAMTVEEVKEPQKDIPRGIIGAIVISTILYIVVTLILTGMVPYDQLAVGDPVSYALRFVGLKGIGTIISIGAIMTLLTVTISMMYSGVRLVYAISKDGLLPKFLQKIDDKTRTPKVATHAVGFVSIFFAAVFPLNVLAELTNIVSLACLVLMAFGILRLRKLSGEPKKGEYKMPFVPVLPIISALACLFLMSRLSLATWVVFGISSLIGLLIYFAYGYRNSNLNPKKSA